MPRSCALLLVTLFSSRTSDAQAPAGAARAVGRIADGNTFCWDEGTAARLSKLRSFEPVAE